MFYAILILLINSAWNTCPYGETDCPGLCGRFFDSDSDGICDFSQLSPEERRMIPDTAQKLQDTASEIQNEIMTPENGGRISTETTEAQADTVSDCYSAVLSNDPASESESLQIVESNDEENKGDLFGKKYHFLPIAVVLTLIFFFSRLLVKLKIISRQFHLKIWNFALFLTFAVSFILAIMLILQANSGKRLDAWFDLLYWHVETASAMAVISLFHMAWHGSYIRNIFKRK
ncbi:hypothetical protein JXL83_00440 [candidate division WOR-3 bacterium]|nr:hypothetical protein [candidate division WOR-3 bacterium]